MRGECSLETPGTMGCFQSLSPPFQVLSGGVFNINAAQINNTQCQDEVFLRAQGQMEG